MESNLEQIKTQFLTDLKKGLKPKDLKNLYLSKDGSIGELLKNLGNLSQSDRAIWGKKINLLKQELEALIEPKEDQIKQDNLDLDPTLPPATLSCGSYHPISAMLERITNIFEDLSFEVVQTNELVSVYDNFESLNIDDNHPARDPKDTFYLSDNLLLRTQTTAAQVLEMHRRFKAQELPIRVVVPGKTYRPEVDLTHNSTFHQIDAIMVDNTTNFTDLRGVLDYFAKRLFGNKVETRFRVHNFPFTEPSAELDFRLKDSVNGGKYSEWLEIGGCGMIHPNVLKRAGINPKIYRGWAFGMSIERPVMILHEIPDIKLLYQNRPAFLAQFKNQI